MQRRMRFQWLMLTGLVGLAVVFLAGEEVVATMRMADMFKEHVGPHQFEMEVAPVAWDQVMVRWLPWLLLSPLIAWVGLRFVPGRASWSLALVAQTLGVVTVATTVWWVDDQAWEWLTGQKVVFMGEALQDTVDSGSPGGPEDLAVGGGGEFAAAEPEISVGWPELPAGGPEFSLGGIEIRILAPPDAASAPHPHPSSGEDWAALGQPPLLNQPPSFGQLPLPQGGSMDPAEDVADNVIMMEGSLWWYWLSYFWRAGSLFVVAIVPALAMLSSERERLRDQLARELAETENRLLRAQLQPHFLFNALNGIQVLIDDDPERAKVVLRRLSALLRNTLEDVNKTMLPLDRELEILDDYLELERLRFGQRVDIAVDIEPGNDAVLVPSFCLQPLVENSLIHGPGTQPGGGKVELVVTRRSENLKILVRDDGPGASPTEVNHGHGLGILRDRLERQFGGRGGLTVETGAGEGFAVALEVPVSGGVS